MKKNLKEEVRAVQNYFPLIYLTCHIDHVRARSSEKHISSHDASVLAHLNASKFCQPSVLAKHLRISPSTLSEWTVRMEELGYLRSRADQDDGRKVILELTDNGKKTIQHFSVLDSKRVTKILEKMSEDERQRVLDGLRLFADFAIES